MPLLDFGLSQGLAYRHDWGRAMELELRQEELDRRARNDAENKARLLGEKFKFGAAENDYDKQGLRQHTDNVLNQMGDFIMKNPTFQSNPYAYAMFSRMADSLINNEYVERDMRLQKEKATLEEFIKQHPGNKYLVQDQLDEIENYNKAGSTDLVRGNKKEYMFRNPLKAYDLEGHWKKYADAAERHGLERNTWSGIDKKFVLEPDKEKQVNAAIDASSREGMIARMLWEQNPDIQKKYNGNIKEWAAANMNSIFKEPEYHYYTGQKEIESRSGRRGTGTGTELQEGLWKQVSLKARQNYNQTVSGTPEAMEKVVRDTDGYIDLSNVELKDSNGNSYASLSLGPMKNARTTGEVIFNKNAKGNDGRYFTKVIVQGNSDEMNKIFGGDVVDKATFGLQSIFGEDEVRDKYKELPLKKTPDGNWMVEMWKPIEGSSASVEAAYDHAHGLGLGRREPTSEQEPIEAYQDANGIWHTADNLNVWDGKKWVPVK